MRGKVFSFKLYGDRILKVNEARNYQYSRVDGARQIVRRLHTILFNVNFIVFGLVTVTFLLAALRKTNLMLGWIKLFCTNFHIVLPHFRILSDKTVTQIARTIITVGIYYNYKCIPQRVATMLVGM